MPVGTVAEAQAIAQDVAAVLDVVAAEVDRQADAALRENLLDRAIVVRQRVEELTRQAARLRDI